MLKKKALQKHGGLAWVILLAKQSHGPALMYFSNEEKALDRVQWDYLKGVLKIMGFEKFFLSWISRIYSLQETEISLEGFKSQRFSLQRGVRQGCPLSPLLFNIMIETLAGNERNSNTAF